MVEENKVIKDSDKDLFLNTINQNGFLLEDKVWKILTRCEGRHAVIDSRNKIFHHRDSRVEIDFVFRKGNYHLIIECKKTHYSWIFPKARERTDTLSLIHCHPHRVKCHSHTTDKYRTAWFDIAVMFKEDGSLDKKNTNSEFARVSYKDVHDNIRQTLKEVEAYVENFTGEKEGLIIPIIVTNAKLHSLDYTKGGIDDDGNLTDFEPLKEIPYLAYNFPENLFKGNALINHSDKELDGVKTVFIVNSNYLKSFIDSLQTDVYWQDYMY